MLVDHSGKFTYLSFIVIYWIPVNGKEGQHHLLDRLYYFITPHYFMFDTLRQQ